MEKTVTVKIKTGLSGRVAAVLVHTASKFECDIKLKNGEMIADAKSIMGVIALKVGYGDEVVIIAKGQREDEATEELQTILTTYQLQSEE